MVFLEEFKNALEENLAVPLKKLRRNQYQVQLVEKHERTKLQELTLDLPECSLVLNIEKAKIQGLFSGSVGSNCRCDYVIFTEIKGVLYLFFIELKSFNPDLSNYKKQFKGAECLIQYSECVIKKFFDKDHYFENFQYRYVLFYKESLSIQPSHADIPLNNTPENAFMYANPDPKESIPLASLSIS